MNKKIKILLTGAGGTVGYEVLKQLCAQPDKYAVTIFVKNSRKSHRLFKTFKNKVEIVYGNITDETCMKTICADKQIVIHLAAVIPPLADEDPVLTDKVNIMGTQYLVKGLEEFSPNAFLLYSSSVSVYGDRLKNPFIKVGDPLSPSNRDGYAKTKIEAESIIGKSGIDWSIFRLTAIMGNHKMSKLMFHMPLATGMEIATPKDAARAFVNAIHKKEILSKNIYNLGGGESMRITYNELLSRSFSIFGLGKPDFPKNTFAEKNFHCGYFTDGDELEQILCFREDTLETYFGQLKKTVSPPKKMIISLLKKLIKRRLIKQSEPLQAILKNDTAEIEHFF